MAWWRRRSKADRRNWPVRLALPGWHYEGMRNDIHGWSDGEGGVITLAIRSLDDGLPDVSDEVSLRHFGRQLAESRGGGLIEVRMSTSRLGPTAAVIYKRLLMPAYVYTGMLLAPHVEPPQVWTIVAEERGTTGVRDATIATALFNAGRMTSEDYERSWAKDPYDSEYHNVDRRVLRFVSDDESYDARFPQHPLTKVRLILAALPTSIEPAPARRTQ